MDGWGGFKKIAEEIAADVLIFIAQVVEERARSGVYCWNRVLVGEEDVDDGVVLGRNPDEGKAELVGQPTDDVCEHWLGDAAEAVDCEERQGEAQAVDDVLGRGDWWTGGAGGDAARGISDGEVNVSHFLLKKEQILLDMTEYKIKAKNIF